MTQWNAIRDNRKFASLMAYDPKAAAQFAIDCWIKTEIHWVPAEEFVKTEEKEKIILVPSDESISETKWFVEDKTEGTGIEIDIDDLRELLKANNIKFHPATGIKKLTVLAIDNKLL